MLLTRIAQSQVNVMRLGREREREIAFGQDANEERKRNRKVRSRANIRIVRLKLEITKHTSCKV